MYETFIQHFILKGIAYEYEKGVSSLLTYLRNVYHTTALLGTLPLKWELFSVSSLRKLFKDLLSEKRIYDIELKIPYWEDTGNIRSE